MFQKKSKNGITLISLVITIIVMLILAGVTISITVGDNGILTQAQNAVEKNRQATALEDVKMAWASLQAEYYSDWARNTGIRYGDIVTKDNLQKYLNGSGTVNNITDNGDGTYLIEYTANEEGKAYLFLADENGNVIMLNGLNITPSVLSLQIITEGTEVTNGTGTLQASLTGISGNVTWTSSNTSIVSITGNGNTATVRAEGEGTATITATCNSGGETYTDESTITVTEVTAVTEISSLVPSSSTVNRGESIQITATVNSGATEELVWTSSDENVTIGEPVISGNTQTVTIAVLSEATAGEKTITVTSANGETNSITITVVVPVTGVTLNETSATLGINGTIELTATVEPEDAGNKNVTWSSSNTSIASITGSGNTVTITAVGGGSATITATSVGDTSKTATCSITVSVTPTTSSVPDSSTSFSTSYGTIDVIWLDTSNNVLSAPNDPTNYLAGMTKVTWTENADHSVISEDATPNENWYNYVAGSGTDDNRESHWANAKDSNGSYFVWIPRYAYRITYYESETSTSPTGYYDGWGMWKSEDGKVKYALNEGVDTVDYNGNKYIVHPAFTNDSDTVGEKTPYDLGGWDSELAGFWVAKYEMSKSNATSSSAGTGRTFKSVPNVKSARGINIGNMYTYGINYDSSKESHLMKNSEWGSVAYLTHSKYGRNGNEIDINNSGDLITGSGGGSPTAKSTKDSSNPGTAYSYNTAIGTKASTTGNVYGVYDMSGGAYEYVAVFNNTDTNGRFSSYGWSGLTTDSASDKYATKYYIETRLASGNNSIFTYGKIGDATKEVSKGGAYGLNTGANFWFGDTPSLCSASAPFLQRGGVYSGIIQAGVFSSGSSSGSSLSGPSFRVVLCP